MAWINAEEVIEFTGVKPKTFNLEKQDDDGLDTLIEKWISHAESLISSYCHYDFDKAEDEVPMAVQNVCLRLTSNMVTLAIQKRDSPIIKVNDWSIQGLSSDIFTDDLKEDLKPFIRDSSNDYTKIGFFAITGKDD